MSRLDGLRYRMRALLHARARERELLAEHAFHRDLEAMQARHAGADDADARASAHRTFGNATYHAEAARAAARFAVVDRVGRDLRYAARQLHRAPVLTGTIAATFALGIGANAAVFSVLDRMLWRAPDGVVDPGGVHRLYALHPHAAGDGRLIPAWSYPEFVEIRNAIGSDATVGADLHMQRVPVGSSASSPTIGVDYVTGGFLEALVDHPTLGRLITSADDSVTDPHPVAVLGYGLWQREFGGDRAIIGRTIEVGGRPFVVVGVAPRGFTGIALDPAELWLPASLGPHESSGPGAPWYESGARWPFEIVARPKRGIALGQVIARASIAYRYGDSDTTGAEDDRSVVAGSIIAGRGPWMASEWRLPARLAGVTLILLVLACANVGTLLLVRGTRRRREIAVRLALGVSRRQLGVQLVTESLLIAVGGGAVALVVAEWSGSVLRALVLPQVQWQERVVNWPVTVLALALAALCGLACGLIPAIASTRPDIAQALRSGGSGDDAARSRLRNGLVVAQVALALTLVAGAGLFVRSLIDVERVDLGFRPNGLFVADVNEGSTNHEVLRRAYAALPDAAARLARVPAVQDAALASGAPFVSLAEARVAIPGVDSTRLARDLPSMLGVGANYFDVLGTAIVDGRGITASDGSGSPLVAVVNETMAHRYWPGRSALGQCIRTLPLPSPCRSVVGVVHDTHEFRLVEAPHPEFFIPLGQMPDHDTLATTLLVRARAGAEASAALATRAVLHDEMPPVLDVPVQTMDALTKGQLGAWRVEAELFAALGILGVLVAGIGIYSVIAYTFSQRTREIGLRMALGARTQQIASLVLRESIRVVGIGVGIGGALALALAHLLASALYGVSPHDPLTLAAAALALWGLGALAALVPAVRAARVDPVSVLAAE